MEVREPSAKYLVKPGFKQTEVGWIPEDWEVRSLGDLAHIERGKFSARPRNDPKYFGGDLAFLQTGDVTRSSGSISSYVQTLNMEGLKVSRAFPRGTLFFTIAANIGDVGIAEFEAACPDSLVAISPYAPTVKRWLLYELAQRKESFEKLASPGAQLNINLEKLRPYLLPVPTMAEQQAIAEALSDADALIESLEQLLTKKRQIKQGAMQELLTGQRRLPGFGGEWEVKRLGDVANFHKGKGLPKSSLTPSGLELCIHYGELFTKYQETIETIISRTNESHDSFRSVANDVLMPTSDVTPRGLAKASCVQIDGVVLGGDVLVIRSDRKRINGSFLSYVIRREEAQVLQLVTGSTVFHLYGSDMKKFTFFAPDIAEQTAIASVLSAMDAEITDLETQLHKTRQLKQGMMQELLTGRIRLV